MMVILRDPEDTGYSLDLRYSHMNGVSQLP